MKRGPFEDLFVRDVTRDLVVRTVHHQDQGKWQVSILDNSEDQLYHGRRLGDLVVGQTSIWCDTWDNTVTQRNYMLAVAKLERWKR